MQAAQPVTHKKVIRPKGYDIQGITGLRRRPGTPGRGRALKKIPPRVGLAAGMLVPVKPETA